MLNEELNNEGFPLLGDLSTLYLYCNEYFTENLYLWKYLTGDNANSPMFNFVFNVVKKPIRRLNTFSC